MVNLSEQFNGEMKVLTKEALCEANVLGGSATFSIQALLLGLTKRVDRTE